MAGVTQFDHIGDFRMMPNDAWRNLYAKFAPIDSSEAMCITETATTQVGDYRVMPNDAWRNLYAKFAPIDSSEATCITETATPQVGDYRVMPISAWANIYAKFQQQDAPASPVARAFAVPEDATGTPVGPHTTPGKPLCFMTGTPDTDVLFPHAYRAARDASGVAQDEMEDSPPLHRRGGKEDDDMEIPMLEAVEPMVPGLPPSDDASLPETGSPKSESRSSAWKRLSSALPRTQTSPAQAIPNAARQMSAQALRAKEQVSEKAQKAKEQVSETVNKSIGFVKDQTGSALKVPAQMSGSVQKTFGLAKDKAGSAREKAQSVSAAVTARVAQTTQKGFDMARGKRMGQQGGA